MNTDTVTLFLALLAVVAQVAIVALVVALATGRRAAVVDAVGPAGLWLAFGVAAVCMAGSLYLSEAANFPPCKLCWYQRIAMYPLVPLLLIGALRRDRAVRPYALALALVGLPISAYHVLLERVPSLESDVCDVTTPCTTIWVKELGYLTIPTMAGIGFALIALLVFVATPERAGRLPAGATT